MNLSPSIIIDRKMRYQTDTPRQTPTNSDRYVEFRSRWQHHPVNNHPWKWLQNYEPNPPTPEEVAEAFRFKYGD